jgi:hypothetical protein
MMTGGRSVAGKVERELLAGSELPQTLKKASRNPAANVRDVCADEPVHAMDRFTAGLKRVLTASKVDVRAKPRRVKRKSPRRG